MSTRAIALLALSLFTNARSASATDQDFQAASARYVDEERSINSLQFGSLLKSGKKQGFETSLGLTGGYKAIHLIRPASGSANQIDQKSLGINVMQGLGPGTGLGPIASYSTSEFSTQSGLGLGAEQWWNHQTMRSAVSYQRIAISSKPINFVDTDGKKVETLPHVMQHSFTTSILALITPRSIASVELGTSLRQDRPPANYAGIEWRQSFNTIVLLGNLTYGETRGVIEPVTMIGELSAYSAKLEGRFQITRRLRIDSGYRFAFEQETPRASDAAIINRGTDTINLAVHQSLVRLQREKHLILQPFTSFTRTNSGVLARLFGLGVSVTRH